MPPVVELSSQSPICSSHSTSTKFEQPPKMCWNTMTKKVCKSCDRHLGRQLVQEPCEDAGSMDRFGRCKNKVKIRDAVESAECGLCRRTREKGKGKATWRVIEATITSSHLISKWQHVMLWLEHWFTRVKIHKYPTSTQGSNFRFYHSHVKLKLSSQNYYQSWPCVSRASSS